MRLKCLEYRHLNAADLCAFFEHVPNLLRGPSSVFSFFNGLGATSMSKFELQFRPSMLTCALCVTDATFYDVYTTLAEIHLQEIGMSVTWTDVHVHAAQNEGVWGNSRKYFSLPYCRVPKVVTAA